MSGTKRDFSTYVIENGEGECKIGRTRGSVESRLRRIQADRSPTMNPLGDQLKLVTSVPFDFEFVMHEGLRQYRSRGEWFRCSRKFVVRRLERYARIVEQSSPERREQLETVKKLYDRAMIRYSLRAPIEWLKDRLQAEYDLSLFGSPILGDGVVRIEPNFELVERLWLHRLKDRDFRSHLCSRENRDCSHYSDLEEEYKHFHSEEIESLVLNSSRPTWTFVVENWLGKFRVGTTQRSVETRVFEMQNNNRINPGIKPLKIVEVVSYDIGRKLHEDLISRHMERVEQNCQIEESVSLYQGNPEYWFLSGDFQYWAHEGWYDVTLQDVQKVVSNSVDFVEENRCGDSIPYQAKYSWKTVRELLQSDNWKKEIQRRVLVQEAIFQHKCRKLLDNVKYQIYSSTENYELDDKLESNENSKANAFNQIDFHRLRQTFNEMMECKKFRRKFEDEWWNTTFCAQVVNAYFQSNSGRQCLPEAKPIVAATATVASPRR